MLSSSFLSVRPSVFPSTSLPVRSHGTIQFPLKGIFMKFGIWLLFEIVSRKFMFHYNLTTITSAVQQDRCTFMIISRSEFFSERQTFHRDIVHKIKTHFTFNNVFLFQKFCLLLDKMEKYCRAGQATDDNITHAPCKLDT